MFLHILLEEEVQDISLLMSFLKLNIMLFRKFSRLLQCLNFIPVNTGIFLHGVDHCDTLERLTEIHLDAVVNDRCGPSTSCAT